MADLIRLQGMTFSAAHGASPGERTRERRFVVDLEVTADLRRAGATDDLADTVNYSTLYGVVRDVLKGPPVNLLESLAERIAERVLRDFPVLAVRVRVGKPGVPVDEGSQAMASVEVYRERGA